MAWSAEKRRAWKREWYRKNAERIRQRNALIGAERVQKNKEYYDKYPDKLRERSLKHNHGITLADYFMLLELQHGECAICGIKDFACRNGILHVDHDHDTDMIRGLLCGSCNRMLGLAKDNPDVLIAGAKYLITFGAGDDDA